MRTSAVTPHVFRIARGSTSALNPAEVASRARAFGAAARSCRQLTLLAYRDDAGGVAGTVLVPASRKVSAAMAQTVAARAAEAVGGTLEPASGLPDLSVSGGGASVLGVAYRSTTATVVRDTAFGADPLDVGRVVGKYPRGTWAAITLRTPVGREIDAYRSWVRLRTGAVTHFSSDSEVMVARLIGGGPDRETVTSVLTELVAVMPGGDIDVRVRFPGSGPLPVLGGVAGLGAWGGLLFGAGQPLAAAGAGIALTGLGLLSAAGVLPTPGDKLAAAAASATFPVARKVARPSREARPAQPPANGVGRGKPAVAQRVPDYPIADDALLVSSPMVVGLIAPASGAASGAAVTAGHPAPPALREPIGPRVGRDSDGAAVHLDAGSLYGGVALVGKPGAGKSVAMRVCLGWSMTQRVHPSGNAGWPGADNTLIVFENKGDGATSCLDWAARTGDVAELIDLADPATPAIDVFAFPGDLRDKSARVVEGLRYAFGDGTIENASIETLNAVLPAAMVLAGNPDTQGSVMGLAHRLLGGRGDEEGVRLSGILAGLAQTGEPDAVAAAENLGVLYGAGMTSAARRSRCDAPRNKLDQVAAMDYWWRPDRKRVSWEEILTGHRAVVVNLGVSPTGALVSDRATQLMSSLLLFTLRDAVQRVCSGWEKQGRSVSVFADELSILAGSSPEVVTWFRMQGRSYGVKPFFATQHPEQLDADVRTALLGFANVFWFGQDNPDIVAGAVRDLELSGDPWSPAEVSSIPNYSAALRANAGGARQSPCLVRIDDLESAPARPASVSAWPDQINFPDGLASVSSRPDLTRGDADAE